MPYVSHPLIKPDSIESRSYQENVVQEALKRNVLCVFPTGLGKTPVAVIVAAHRLEKYPGSSILVLAPTKPLTNQNYEVFRKFLNLVGDGDPFQVVTGTIPPEKRKGLYRTKKLLFATPQTIHNDLKSGIISLKDFSLLVTDEAHHSVGGYSYPYIAKRYLEEAEHPRVLALTASPGATRQKIEEIYKSLGLEAIEIKTERDEDVSPYVKEKYIEWVSVDLPESFLQIKKLIEGVYFEKLNSIKRMGFRKPVKLINRRDLLNLQVALQKQISRGNRAAFGMVSTVAQAIKLEHALMLLETQGIAVLENYWKKLREDQSKGALAIVNDRSISNAMWLTRGLHESGSTHPKMGKLLGIVNRELLENPNSRIIVFATYRETVKGIAAALGNLQNARPFEFIGQKGGLTQKEQIARLERFKSGEYNILVGTSISEEGLDIASANIAIFYEPVPSPLRAIQRRGRVGRADVGRVIILMAKNTRDEAYHWSAVQKERKMKDTLLDMRGGQENEK
ncbi:MAG: DEAD/DEAH box helicase [Candidatus Aenigmarchaeota archaeon]|nr:DEAD/DEAH box helicase [Candidatus Aenigmarchaeota archaeon]